MEVKIIVRKISLEYKIEQNNYDIVHVLSVIVISISLRIEFCINYNCV